MCMQVHLYLSSKLQKSTLLVACNVHYLSSKLQSWTKDCRKK